MSTVITTLNATQKVQVVRSMDGHARGSRNPWPGIGYEELTRRLSDELGFPISVSSVKLLCAAAGHADFFKNKQGHSNGGRYGKRELVAAVKLIVRDLGSLASPELRSLMSEFLDEPETNGELF